MPRLAVVSRLDDPEAVRALVFAAFADFSEDDWNHCLGGAHVLAYDGADLVAHAAVVPRRLWVGTRPVTAGYVEGVAVRPDHQGRGIGTLVMGSVADLVAAYGLGVLSTGRTAFYERLGWERWRGATYVRSGDEVVRTADEDDGIMVLRGREPIDLTADITCEARSGDDW